MPITTAAQAATESLAARPQAMNVNAPPVVAMANAILARVEDRIAQRPATRTVQGRTITKSAAVDHNRRRWLPYLPDPFGPFEATEQIKWLARERLAASGFRFGTIDTEDGPVFAMIWGAA